MRHYSWTKGNYTISTDPSNIPLSKLNAAFASEDFYWAKSLPEDVLRKTLHNSLKFSVFYIAEGNSGDAAREAPPEFVGFARCITDFITFLYFTDVYIWPVHQGAGIGKWLVSCIQEVIEDMPYLRRSLCFTGDWERSVPFYEKFMGMEVVESRRGRDGSSGVGLAVLMRLGDGSPSKVSRAV